MSEPVPAVFHGRGNVYVDGFLIAPGHAPQLSFAQERVLARVRERTSDDWWRSAAAIQAASEHDTTGGPLGAGVDFFADEMGNSVPSDVRAEIAADAYEAARSVIVEGIEDHARRLLPCAAAVATSGREVQS